MTLIEKAVRLAAAAHKEQVRKSDGSPYIAHPIMVAMLLQEYGFGEVTIAAAVVHDVLEDTDYSRDQIEQTLGREVLEIVSAVSENTDLVWEERKKEYVQAVAVADESVKAVSIADKIHNAESVINDYKTKGSAVWQPFNRGKEKKIWFEELLYAAVAESWQHPLLDRYQQAITILKTLDE